jgi:polar amino acid transport system substrate-binding protein
MSLLSKSSLIRVTLAAFILGAVLMHRAEAADLLTVCIDQANPTARMDLRVARAAAKTQGYGIKKVPFVGYGKGDDGFPPSRFSKMAKSDCQIIMGFPVDMSNPNLPPNVLATSAYASTGFVLVSRGNSKNLGLSELPKGSEVGIAQLDTYAGLLYAIHPNIVMHVYEKDAMMLADLAARHIAAGVAWQPFIESYESSHPKRASLNMRVLPDKHMLWNLVALYGSDFQDAANVFNKGLYELQTQGKLKSLVAPYQQATQAEVQHASARWSAPHLQAAVAWSTDRGRWIQVTDTSNSITAKHTSSANHSKVPALYTADQATKGALAYYQNCAMCHGPNLDGQPAGYSGPALKGKDFADPSYNFHVSDIFNFVSKQMPAATPGSLSHEEYEQIMAFILQQNGYPPGPTALVYAEAEKSSVPIRYHGN